MSANATIKNDQAVSQRNVIRGIPATTALGASVETVINLFPHQNAPKPSDMENIEKVFNTSTIRKGDNVDFNVEDVDLTYKDPSELYTDVASQDDIPSTKGPQLRTIKIGDNGAPDIQNSNLESGLANTSYIGRNRGFGVTEELRPFPGRYNSRANVTLGDYITPGE